MSQREVTWEELENKATDAFLQYANTQERLLAKLESEEGLGSHGWERLDESKRGMVAAITALATVKGLKPKT